MIAYCWAGGVIGFGRKVPAGALEIARGPAKPLRKWIDVMARHAYDGKTLLVPGIPEAPDERAALKALHQFIKWIRHPRRLVPAGITVIGSKA